MAICPRPLEAQVGKLLPFQMRLLAIFFVLAGFGGAAASELTVSGTRFQIDGKPFPYTGVSFFNAIYNTNFNASSEARVVWLKKFQSYGINVLRVWCQWDSTRGFVDTTPSNTMYHADGLLRAEALRTLKSILGNADNSGLCVELVLFSHESWGEDRRIAPPADERAVAALTRELLPFRNVTFQIWNEHTDARVLPLMEAITSPTLSLEVLRSAGEPATMRVTWNPPATGLASIPR